MSTFSLTIVAPSGVIAQTPLTNGGGEDHLGSISQVIAAHQVSPVTHEAAGSGTKDVTPASTWRAPTRRELESRRGRQYVAGCAGQSCFACAGVVPRRCLSRDVPELFASEFSQGAGSVVEATASVDLSDAHMAVTGACARLPRCWFNRTLLLPCIEGRSGCRAVAFGRLPGDVSAVRSATPLPAAG